MPTLLLDLRLDLCDEFPLTRRTTMAETSSIGGKVRLVRESRKLTLEQLAERAELRTELIARIESGALIPSLGPLVRIARAVGVRLGTFLDDQENVGPVVVRSGDQRTVMHVSDKSEPARSDLDLFPLALNKTGRHMEPFLGDIYPSSAEDAKLSAHEGEEFIHVLSGGVEVTYGSETYALAAGDSIYYDSIVPHHVHCRGERAARILAVVYTPW
jgi:transcriptional regulator with XRE-family HTH domain